MLMGREQIERRIPHKGAMCLLNEVLHLKREDISCVALSHVARDNPLSRDGILPVIAGLEYGAQAMALHGALTGALGETPKMGVVASVRALRWSVTRLDDIAAPLEVGARYLSGNGEQVSYDFEIRAQGRSLISGRIVALLRKEFP